MDPEAKTEEKAAAKKQMLCMLFFLISAIVGVVCLALFTDGDGMCLQAKSLGDCKKNGLEIWRVYQEEKDQVREAILECCELWDKEMCQDNGNEINIVTTLDLTEQYNCTFGQTSETVEDECAWGGCEW